MAYTPPPIGIVNYTKQLPIFIPVYTAVNFNISEDNVGFTATSVIVDLLFDTAVLTEAILLYPDSILTSTYIETQPFQVMWELGAESILVDTYSELDYIRILPDCIPFSIMVDTLTSIQEMKAGGPQDLPFVLGNTLEFVYSPFIETDLFFDVEWKNAVATDEFIDIIESEMVFSDDEISMSFGVLPFKDHSVLLQDSEFHSYDAESIMNWNIFKFYDMFKKVDYGFFFQYTVQKDVLWNAPGPNDMHKVVTYANLVELSLTFNVNWNIPGYKGFKDTFYTIPWGPLSYYPYCLTTYFAPEVGKVNFKVNEVIDESMTNISFNIIFDVKGYNTDPRCPYDHIHSGGRDPYIDGIDVEITYPYTPQEKESYYMLNTILVRRLPDNLPLEVTSVSMKYDRQSWLWQFSLTIGKDKNEYLELIKPDPGNLNIFTDIAISINGWEWVCRVESWNESVVFGKTGWTVSGRSPSMELGTPQNQKTSHIYDPTGTSPTAGGQIIDEILEGSTLLGIPNTGWTVDWSAYTTGIHTGFDPYSAATWGIQPNTFTWTDKTQIEAVKMLLDSIGAFVMTNAYCIDTARKKLIVRPHYDEPPWHWKESSPHMPDIDHVVNVSYASEIGRNYTSLTTYNAVFVMGQAETEAQDTNTSPGIVVVDVYRDGFGPGTRIYAADIVDPNITSWQAALERGRMTICETGEWIKHTLRLFSLATYGTPSPLISGVILPGDFIRVNDKGQYWFGVVDSTDISGTLSGGPVVYQSIEVRQYIGN